MQIHVSPFHVFLQTFFQQEIAEAVREARQADPSSIDEDKTWYHRHTNKHTSEQWGTPQEEWAAAQDLVGPQRRSRELEGGVGDVVGLGDSFAFSNIFGGGDGGDQSAGEVDNEDGEDY